MNMNEHAVTDAAILDRPPADASCINTVTNHASLRPKSETDVGDALSGSAAASGTNNSERGGNLARILGRCPTTGAGVHRWIFSAALKLKHCDEGIAHELIARAVAECGRPVPDREIKDAV